MPASFPYCEALVAVDDALRVAIIRVSNNLGIATELSARELAYGLAPQVPLVEKNDR